MGEELKPCPCCGSGEAAIKVMTVGTFRVFCESCRLCIPGCQTREEAIEAWNTRAPQSEWISVKDRLPTKSKCGVLSDNVLTFNFGKVDILCFFHEESRFTRHGCDTQKPTHWMPLPAPPKQ